MVFLATDDSEAMDRFRETFGEKLVYYRDVILKQWEMKR